MPWSEIWLRSQMFHFVDCVHYDVLLSEQDNKKYVSIVDTKVQTRNVHNICPNIWESQCTNFVLQRFAAHKYCYRYTVSSIFCSFCIKIFLNSVRNISYGYLVGDSIYYKLHVRILWYTFWVINIWHLDSRGFLTTIKDIKQIKVWLIAHNRRCELTYLYCRTTMFPCSR